MSSLTPDPNFYWQTARDSLLTPAALRLFQIALLHEGEDFDQAKIAIDDEYEAAGGLSPTERHGGNFQTFIRVFEEAGWMYVESTQDAKILRSTPAGRQAQQLLIKVPSPLQAAPYFLIELLARYQLNNPVGREEARNQSIREARERSDIFPYWTLWKIMRGSDNRVSTDELRRFVFRLQRSEDIDAVISTIKGYRRDVQQGLSEEEINSKYSLPLEGAVGEPKYIMARAGRHIGQKPPLITKPDSVTYELNSLYLPFIDEVLANEPVFKEYVDPLMWIKDYGRPVLLEPEFLPFSLPAQDPDAQLNYIALPDDDPVWNQVQELVAMNAKNILFAGPPGTSKTTYALAIGAKLADNKAARFHNIQFHQSFGYEDFMEGWIPSTDDEKFILKDKIFKNACNAARKEPHLIHVLVIDELNRGEPSRIFGEALTYIERRDEAFELSSGRRVFVPANLIILATINPYDKSISDLDQAMDRRFEKILMKPNSEILRKMLIELNGVDRALAGRILVFFNRLNVEMENRIGHAYFKDVRDIPTLQTVWNHRILPLIQKELRFASDTRQRIIEDFKQVSTNPQDITGTETP